MKEAYINGKFMQRQMELIAICDGIIEDYVSQGYMLTVRQIYYQLVAKNVIENSVKSYDNIQSMLNKARLCGLLDWDAIEDRTREIMERASWSSGGQILGIVAKQYHEDIWDNQPNRVFAVVEKEALAGVLDRVCKMWSVPLLPARGYPSATTLRELAKERILGSEQNIIVLHLGDHDPSGIDMSRDLQDRLELFSRGQPIEFRRIALNMDQVLEQNPPPNPAKPSDARYQKYVEEFGVDESWELDALTPKFITDLVDDEVQSFIDADLWSERSERIEEVRTRLQVMAETFNKET